MQDEEKGIKEMEERIAEAAKEEGSNIPDENHLPAEIKPTFVRRCCEHTEKGDGILHSAIWRGKLVYVPELRQWFTGKGNAGSKSIRTLSSRASTLWPQNTERLRNITKNYHEKRKTPETKTKETGSKLSREGCLPVQNT